MQVLVLSDVHSNLVALQAVLADAGSFDAIWSLGDVVGYGPQPNECIELLLSYPHLAVAGNHDWGSLGKMDLRDFNVDARQANLWTREQLSARSWGYLEALPETLEEDDFTLVHGSPRYPLIEYLVYPSLARQSLSFFSTSVCFVGHSHIPSLFACTDSEVRVVTPALDVPLKLGNERYIINPGSVGQPRDGDPRASYMMLETGEHTITYRRVVYDISVPQALMQEANLPPRSIARLEFGW